MSARVILVEATPRRAADGVAETVRLAGGGADHGYYYGGDHWRAGIVQLPMIVTSINFRGGDFGEGGTPQAAELQWAASSAEDLAAIASYFWTDAPITVRIGPENGTGVLPPIRIVGKVLSALVDGGTLRIQLSDPAADLKKPLLTDRYSGTGGLDGPVEWDGKLKRRIWGRVWNLDGEPIDKANNIYAFADTRRRLMAIDAVRDKGAAAASVTTLGWQGSAEASFAALQAASAPRGGGVLCPSIACVKWWTQPAGDLTADLRGEIGAAYVETTAEIVERLVQAGPATPFAAGTINAARLARQAPIGWVAEDDSTTVASMIEALLGNVSLLWLLNSAGEIVLRQWAWGASVASAKSASVRRTDVLRPVATRTLGYRRNETVMARGDLAAIVLAEDVQFSGGLSGDDIQAKIDSLEVIADGAVADIEAAAADGILSRKEKSSIVIPRDGELEQSWTLLDGKAATLSGFAVVAAARTAASNARQAWHVYRDALSPAWNNANFDTAVDRATLTGKLNDFSYALDALADALRQAVAVNNVNRVRNSQFERGTQGWAVVHQSANVTVTSALSVANVAGVSSLEVTASSSGGTGQDISIGTDYANNYWIPVVAGERLSWQARLGASGTALATLAAYVHWYNATGTRISTTQVAGAFSAADGTLFNLFVTVPAGAINAIIEYQCFFSGAGSITMKFGAPMVSSATAEQTIFPPFTAGPPDGGDGAPGSPGAPGAPGSDGTSPYMLALSNTAIIIQASATGVTKAGQVPRSIALSLVQGTSNVTGSAAIGLSPSSASIAASYSGGTISLTQADVSGYIDVTATVSSVVVGTQRIQISRQLDPAPPASQTSGAAQVAASVSNTAHPGIYGGSITLQANGSGQLACSGGGEYSVPDNPSLRTFTMSGAFAYRPAGSSTWSYTADVAGSAASNRPIGEAPSGSLTLSQTISGLASGAFYEVALSIRRSSGNSTSADFFGQFTVSQ